MRGNGIHLGKRSVNPGLFKAERPPLIHVLIDSEEQTLTKKEPTHTTGR